MIEEIIKYHEEAAKSAARLKMQGLSFDERATVYFHELAVKELQKLKNLTKQLDR